MTYDFWLVKKSFDLQRSLSKSQAIPLLGPFAISPIKAAVGVVQIIVGIAMAIIPLVLGGLFWAFKCNDSLATDLGIFGFKFLGVAGVGLLALAYSVGNIATLGFLAFRIESNNQIPYW